MKYSIVSKQIVEYAVTKWFKRGLYPSHWTLDNQIRGAHAECAAFIARYGENFGVKRWYEEANRKREEYGNDPKQKDDYDLVGATGELIDAKWIPAYDQIWVTESTHRMSSYTVLAGIKFNENMTEFDIYRISRQDFDENCDSPRRNKLRVAMERCEKVEKL